MTSTLPTGTVTFLFTDIEGSTRLWEQHPAAMKIALTRHDGLLRSNIQANGGHIVKTTGDGLMAVFAQAAEGALAALACQLALTRETWDELPQPLRVRMGLHTGEADFRDNDYFGSDLNRTARIMSIAHGGQILLSAVTAHLLQDVSLHDLGEHRIKDLAQPQRIFQLNSAGLPTDFPPLRSLNTLNRIKLMIVDDHKLFREGLKALLSITEDIEIIGEAGDGASALTQCDESQPEIILMDIDMPGLNGIQTTQQILAKYPKIGIIMLTMLEDDTSVFRAMRAGARGYLLKGADSGEMISVIRAVADGQALFGPTIAARLMNYFKDLEASPVPPQADGPFPELTERELEILKIISQGHSNQEIAQRLVVSPKTVRNHITNIFSKLQVADRAQAIVRARQAGLQ